MSKKKIVIIGGVACGPKAASRIRRLDPAAEITIIEKGELLSYAGCGLPFYLSGEVHDYKELMTTPAGVVRDTIFFKNVKDIAVLNRTIAKSIDRKGKAVHAVKVDSGEEIIIPYDQLVLATGANPAAPPIPGMDLNGVNFLTTVEDGRKIREMEKNLSGKNAVIIGGGLIGIEVTESFVKQGMHVTIIEKMNKVLPSLLDDEMAFHVHNELKAKGVNLVLDASLTKINGDDQGNVIGVSTSKGGFPADLVLVAVGNKSTVALAADSGLEIGETGAIRINSHLQTSDPSIYAGGDCVENISLVTGKPIYAPMGSTANKHGRVIADNICGKKSVFPGVLGTVICRVFDINIARTGLTETAARKAGHQVVTVLSPSPDRPHFHPEASLIIIKLIVDSGSRKILGAQIVGPGDVAKRIEVTITGMTHGLKVDDFSNLDLAYAPPFSPAMDNIITAANIAQNKIDGIALSLTPVEVKEKIDRNDDFIFLDVRSPQEFDQIKIDDKRVTLIPLGKLRERCGELPKEKEIIPFCKISLRGYEAQKILESSGFKNVRFMDGGIVCWPYAKIGKK